MLFRFIISCFIGLAASFVSAAPSELPFPAKLEGKWEQAGNDEKGSIHIVITKKEGNTIYGIMTLTGSAYCKEPIPFRGKGEKNVANISGDAPIICGYGGELTGEVSRVNNEVYRGNFVYKWLNITWAKGTFQLSPTKD